MAAQLFDVQVKALSQGFLFNLLIVACFCLQQAPTLSMKEFSSQRPSLSSVHAVTEQMLATICPHSLVL